MKKRKTVTQKSIALGMAAWFLFAPCGGKIFAATTPSPAGSNEATTEPSKALKAPKEREIERPPRKDTSLSTGAIVAAIATIALGILAVSASGDDR